MKLIVGDNLELKGSLKYGNKTYKVSDIEGYIDFEDVGIPTGFYGGNATAIAKTKNDKVFIVMHNDKPIDLLVKVEEAKKEAKEAPKTNGKSK